MRKLIQDVDIDPARRDAAAEAILKMTKGKIDNKKVAEQVRVKFQLPPHWEMRGDFVNKLRKKHGYPIPPRGGFRVKNGVETSAVKVAPEQAAVELHATPSPEDRNLVFAALKAKFAETCKEYNIERASLHYKDGIATGDILPAEPEPISI